MSMSREQMTEFLVETSEKIFNAEGRLDSIFFGIRDTGEIDIIQTPWTNEEEKSAMLGMVRSHFRDVQTKMYGHVSEVWIKTVDGRGPYPVLKPSQYEDREEKIIIAVVDRDGQSVITRRIERPFDGSSPSLGPVEELSSSGTLSGRLMSLLPDEEVLVS